MRVVIVYSSDPVYLDPFILRILKKYHHTICGVIQTQGDITKKKNIFERLNYALALFLILGWKQFFKNILSILKKKINSSSEIKDFCNSHTIPFFYVSSINSKACISHLKSLQCDVIFNQSHHIVKLNVLEIPAIGVLNRHGAFLPKYRGRLAPFWQLLNNELYGGVTYHLLNEKIDDGPIVVQEKISIHKNDSFNSLVERMFDMAVDKFGSAIEKLEKTEWRLNLIPNDPQEATYFPSPTLKDAIKYRFKKRDK